MLPDTRNTLLAGLPWAERELLQRELEPVTLRAGDIVESPDVRNAGIYFLASGLVSISVPLGNGISAEVAHIGRDGFCGIGPLLGGTSTGRITHARIGGAALKAEVSTVLDLMARRPTLRRHLMAFVHRLLEDVSHEANCARRHALPGRLATRLLVLARLLESRELPVTHEVLAGMLGVRRAGVSIAMKRLQTSGTLSQRWGVVALRDPVALHRLSCGCSGSLPAWLAPSAHDDLRGSLTPQPVLPSM